MSIFYSTELTGKYIENLYNVRTHAFKNYDILRSKKIELVIKGLQFHVAPQKL